MRFDKSFHVHAVSDWSFFSLFTSKKQENAIFIIIILIYLKSYDFMNFIVAFDCIINQHSTRHIHFN